MPELTSAPEDVGTIRNWNEDAPPVVVTDAEEDVLTGLHRTDPVTASKLRAAVEQFPTVGSDFAGFRLVGALGTGTFGRVYLANQGELAERHVALKVSADLADESRALARLQHTNIVPIYSVHRSGALQAVCMPFLGLNTLAHLLKKFRGAAPVPASGRQLLDTLKVLNGDTKFAEPIGPGPDDYEILTDSAALRVGGFNDVLRDATYPDAVCWIVSRLADGLAHAHAHGILHNDLKPANVLLTDDGQPMLLDFGVAEEWKLRGTTPATTIGGTLPYMSPEHVESVKNRRPATDPRSDVYALGILLYEMLTGHYPFRFPDGKFEDELPRIIEERKAAPPRLRHLNPAVTPGLEAIVRKCLEHDPARRFQKAADLRDELERHRLGHALVFTRVPSIRERVRKWAARHPWVSSNLTLGTAAAVVIGLCVAGLSARGARIARHEAAAVSRELTGDVRSAHYSLSTRAPEARTVDAGIGHARAALARYGLPDDAAWDTRGRFTALPADEQAKVREQLSEACLLLARGYSQQAAAGDAAKLTDAVRFNELAERLSGDAPRAVWEQHSALYRLAGKALEADRAAARAKDAPVKSAHDYYLSGNEAVAEGRHRDAIALFTKAAELDPAHYWTHMGLGVASESLTLMNEAIGHYTAAIALWPDSEWAYQRRGQAALRVRDYRRAKADLDKVVSMTPDNADVYVDRAFVFQGLRKWAEAIADCDKALELGAPHARVVLVRARIRELAGDKAGYARDLAEGLKTVPTEELGWTTRGTARLDSDPAAAVKDFDAALGLNPRSVAAAQNKSSALSKLGKHNEAIKTLDALLELYPDYVSGRIARGVQHAREGHTAEALADATETLKRDNNAATRYQAANIYALLSRIDPAHKAAAINHLTAALRGGFGYEYVEGDKDLDPLRGAPEFQRVQAAVRSLTATVR